MSHAKHQIQPFDPLAKGGVRRYLDAVYPDEYSPTISDINLSELSLTGLADLYGSDKGTLKHCYTTEYEAIINSVINGGNRKLANIKVAEFGVACGSSLKMWLDYLPGGSVVGFDIRPECSRLPLVRSGRASIEIADVSSLDESIRNKYLNTFDLIIDDASHISEQITKTFFATWDWLTPGGVYVIEDLSCTYSNEYAHNYARQFKRREENNRNSFSSFVDELMRTVDQKHSIGRLVYTPQLLAIYKLKSIDKS